MEKKKEEIINKVKIKMLGNYKDYINGEVYEIDEPLAVAFVLMGLAIYN